MITPTMLHVIARMICITSKSVKDAFTKNFSDGNSETFEIMHRVAKSLLIDLFLLNAIFSQIS